MNLFSLAAFDWLWETIYGLFLVICDLLYSLIVWLYQVFVTVAKVNLFDRQTFDLITGRIYVIVGIAMLFIFAYNIILLIINPDDKKEIGNNGKIIKETVISFVLIILMPTIFNWLYRFQNNVLDSGILQTVILGEAAVTTEDTSNCKEGDYDCTCDFSSFVNLDKYTNKKYAWWEYVLIYGIIEDINNATNTPDPKTSLTTLCNNFNNQKSHTKGAYTIPPLLMSSFYKPKAFSLDECEEYLKGGGTRSFTDEEGEVCGNYFYNLTASKYLGNVGAFVSDEFLRQVVTDSEKDLLEFNWIIAIIAGGLAVYMFFCYAMEIGVRVAKLGVLQLLSPIPIMMRIVPKQKEAVFDKWLKQLIETYLDVFIRLIIIYFCLFAITLVPGVIDNFFNSLSGIDTAWHVKGLAIVFVILGILKFAQDVPGLLKEFFGGSGKFALRSPKKQLQDNKLAMGALGGLQAGVSTGVKNFNHAGPGLKNRIKGIGSAAAGATSGMLRGARAGYKSQNFKDLKYNTSGAIDRAIQARNDRDIRQAYDKKHFAGAYKAMESATAFQRWISSDSYASLSAKSKNVKEMQSAFDSVIKMVEGKLDELPELFTYNGRTLGSYKTEAESARNAAETFDSRRYEYEENYRKNHIGATDEEVRDAFEKEKSRLREEAGVLAHNYSRIREAVADQAIRQGGLEGDGKVEVKDLREVKIDADGIARQVKKAVEEGTVNIGKEIKGVGDAIDNANNLFEKNSELLSDTVRQGIEEHRSDIRKNNGMLKGELGDINKRLSNLSELEKSKK